MDRPRPSATGPRADLLRVVAAAGDRGLHFTDVMGGLNKEGRHARASTVTLLLQLRKFGFVGYIKTRSAREGGGLYTITPAGREFMALCGIDPVPDDEPTTSAVTITTGAMKGESRQVRHSRACDAPGPLGLVASVWDLGGGAAA